MHDALKNVTSILDSQQRQQAYYEYAPFGGLLSAEEDMAHENKFRFSCEYADDELGLVYYNYRHLNPADGRWISRDLIAEQGEWNLYAFIRNASGYDTLGLIEGGMGAIINGSFGQPPFSHPSSPIKEYPTPKSEEDIQFPIHGTVILSINDLIRHVNAGSVPLSIEIEKTGALRVDYNKLVQSLKDADLTPEEATAVRDKIKMEFRSKQTTLGKAITKAILARRASQGYPRGNFNPSKTNPSITAAGKLMRTAGRGMIIFSAGVEIYNIYEAPEDEKGKAIVQAGGRFGGGILGGMAAGAIIGGTSLNPIGIGVGTIAGGIAGSALGEWIVNLVCSDDNNSNKWKPISPGHIIPPMGF